MQWGGLLSLKETEINISALEDTFPVMEARNLTLAFILMLAFTVTFALIAYQEIFSPVLMTLTKPAPGFQSSKLLNAHCWHYSVTNVKCLACKAGKFEDRSRYFACRVSCSRGNCSFFVISWRGEKGEMAMWNKGDRFCHQADEAPYTKCAAVVCCPPTHTTNLRLTPEMQIEEQKRRKKTHQWLWSEIQESSLRPPATILCDIQHLRWCEQGSIHHFITAWHKFYMSS